MFTRIVSPGVAFAALLAVPSLAAAADVEPPVSLHDSVVRMAVERSMAEGSVEQVGSTSARRRSQARTWSGVGLIALGLFMPIQKETCLVSVLVSGCVTEPYTPGIAAAAGLIGTSLVVLNVHGAQHATHGRRVQQLQGRFKDAGSPLTRGTKPAS